MQAFGRKQNGKILVSGKDFVVFGEDFNRHPHCCEHLMRQFLPHNRILWVQTAGMRGPRVSVADFKRVGQKLRDWTTPTQAKLPEGLTLISPLMIPYPANRVVRKLNALSVNRAVSASIKALGFKKPTVITTIPTTPDFITIKDASTTVYYCVDDFSLWPGFPGKMIAKLEKELIAKVDAVVTTSDKLRETKSKNGIQAHVLPHGVDLSHFLLPEKIRKICEPFTLGMFGLIDERIDTNLIEQILTSDETLSIEIIGKITVEHNIFKHPRVKLAGEISYAQLPSLLNGIDVFILPYKKNALTENINPLKAREYLATGRPVVATDLRELKKIPNGLLLAEDAAQFLKYIELLKTGAVRHQREEVLRALSTSSWKQRANDFAEILNA